MISAVLCGFFFLIAKAFSGKQLHSQCSSKMSLCSLWKASQSVQSTLQFYLTSNTADQQSASCFSPAHACPVYIYIQVERSLYCDMQNLLGNASRDQKTTSKALDWNRSWFVIIFLFNKQHWKHSTSIKYGFVLFSFNSLQLHNLISYRNADKMFRYWILIL